jgi:type II secretory pathway component PulJ
MPLLIKNKRLRFFTLLEVIIAATLTALLLSSISYFFRQVAWLDQQAEQEKKEGFQIRYAEARLMQVIPYIKREYFSGKKHFYFFTEADGLFAPDSQSLIFVYHSGVNDKPELSELSLGRIYLDKENRFCLTSWSSPETWHENTPTTVLHEILLENVESLSFKFYSVPEKDRAKINANFHETAPIIEPEKGEWLSEWKQDYRQIPPMIKIFVKRYKKSNKEELQEFVYAFPCPESSRVVFYES